MENVQEELSKEYLTNNPLVINKIKPATFIEHIDKYFDYRFNQNKTMDYITTAIHGNEAINYDYIYRSVCRDINNLAKYIGFEEINNALK